MLARQRQREALVGLGDSRDLVSVFRTPLMASDIIPALESHVLDSEELQDLGVAQEVLEDTQDFQVNEDLVVQEAVST